VGVENRVVEQLLALKMQIRERFYLCLSAGASRGNTVAAAKLSSIVLIFISFITLTGLAAAISPSGLGYVGVHTAGQKSFDETISVAISPDETILATGTEGYVAITSIETRELLVILSVEDHATALEFSPSGDFLAVGLKSDTPQSTALRIYATSDWSEFGSGFNNGKKPQDISFTDSGDKILVQGQNKDAFELSFPDLEVLGHLENLHVDEMRCSDYGTGGEIAITGGLDGVVGLWDMSDFSLTSSHEFEDEIADCVISPDSLTYSVLESNGQFQTFWMNGTLIEDSFIDFLAAKQIKWSDDGDHIFVLESHLLPSLQRVRATDWIIDEITYIGHQVRAFDITVDGQTMVTSTGTIHVGTYQSNYKAAGYGESGPDFDGDGVPDSIDADDDGDGINDIYDLSCSTNTDCSKSADPEFIRNVEFKIDSQTLIISDSITYDRYDSNALRNLTTSLLIDDNKIDVDELSWMSLAMCDNILERDVVDQWQTLLNIEGAQLTNGTLSCDSVDGISTNNFGDLSLRATLTWVTTFDLSASPLAPYNITVKGVSESPTGSSALIAPQFPVSMDFTHSMAVDSTIEMWVKEDGTITVFMDEVPASAPGVDDLVMSFILANLWLPIGSILGMIGGAALIMKQNKAISSALLRSSVDGDEEEEEEEEQEDYYETEEFEEEEFEEEEFDDEEEVWTQDSDQSPPKPKRGPPRASTRRAAKIPYQPSEDKPVKARRQRISDTKPSGSKRKVLADIASAEDEYDYGLDGVYHDSAWETEYDQFEAPKVRKVKKAEVVEEVEEPVEKSKSRRKVKRRNPKKEKKESEAPEEDAAKKTSSKKRITKPLKSEVSDAFEPSDDDEDSAMDKALGMLTGSKDD